MNLCKTGCSLVTLLLAVLGSAQTDVLTQHNDNYRTGAVLTETRLTKSSLRSGAFKLLAKLPVDGQIYTQPLVVSRVPYNTSISNVTQYRDLLFVGTANDTMYCFDVTSNSKSPVWSVSLGTPVPDEDVDSDDMAPVIGIVSTPVIDRAAHTIWVVAKTKEVNNGVANYFSRLHALDLYTGNELPNSPVAISGGVAGTADDGIGGTVYFNPLRQMNRPGLLLDGGVIYIAFASHGDVNPYHGWVFAYDAKTLAQISLYCTTPNGDDSYYLPSGAGGIWQAGQGLACDESHFVYCMSGNGAFSHDASGAQTGNSFLKLQLTPGGLGLADFFTPYDSDWMNEIDADLGAAGVMLIPDTNLLIGSGKTPNIFVCDRGNLGGFTPSGDMCLQRLNSLANGVYTSPVYFNSSVWGPIIYEGAVNDLVRAFQFTNGLLEPNAFQLSGVIASWPGTMMSLSANGQQEPILWAVQCEPDGSTGVLRALDAEQIGTELWNSDMNPGDTVGRFAKFCPPTVANGKVFVVTFSNAVDFYGLVPVLGGK